MHHSGHLDTSAHMLVHCCLLPAQQNAEPLQSTTMNEHHAAVDPATAHLRLFLLQQQCRVQCSRQPTCNHYTTPLHGLVLQGIAAAAYQFMCTCAHLCTLVHVRHSCNTCTLVPDQQHTQSMQCLLHSHTMACSPPRSSRLCLKKPRMEATAAVASSAVL